MAFHAFPYSIDVTNVLQARHTMQSVDNVQEIYHTAENTMTYDRKLYVCSYVIDFWDF